MKKLAIISAITMAIASGSAMAAQQGDVQFFGNVSAKTCDIAPEVDGSVNNLVKLGTVNKGVDGDVIEFSLKAVDPAGQDCASLGTTNMATVSWAGPLNTTGLANQGGLASDAVVLFKAVNSDTQNTPITSGANSTSFVENLVNTVGYKFSAQLRGGQQLGDFKSAAAYAVTYQ